MWSYLTTRSFISPLPGYVENKAGDETLTVAAMRVSKSRLFVRWNLCAETQPQLQPALLKLSAITSQFFIRFWAMALMIMPVGLNCGFEFEKRRQLLICMRNKASNIAALCGDNPKLSPVAIRT
jgi:hypothetical protein